MNHDRDQSLKTGEQEGGSFLRQRNIICFAGEDWWYHNPHSNLHIMKSFARNNRVLFVNSIGVRMPSFKNDKFAGKRILGKLKSLLRYLKKAEENLWVLTPFALPIIPKWESWILPLNKALVLFQMKLVIWRLNFEDPVLWVTLPSVKDVVLELRKKISRCLVYYCVDNISQFEGGDQNRIYEQEVAIHSGSDLAFFVNHDLLDERKRHNPSTYFLSHGVDYEHFAAAGKAGLEVPEDIRSIARPIAGYIGVIRDVDFDLVKFLAAKNPGVSFVFIGEIYSELAEFSSIPNVHFLGRKPYEDLPRYIQCFDACTLYYKTGDGFNDYRNPKKLLEYLGTGIPIVSVSIREMKRFEEFVYVAETYEEFGQKLQAAMSEKSPEKAAARQAFAAAHTWDAVADQAGSRIARILDHER